MGGEMKLKPCPFCGAHPHHGQTKIEYDQLHGEPFQRFRVWCPHDCASKTAVNRDLAIAAWNRRSPDPELAEALTEMVRTCRPTPIIAAQGVKALNKARALLSRIREGGEG